MSDTKLKGDPAVESGALLGDDLMAHIKGFVAAGIVLNARIKAENALDQTPSRKAFIDGLMYAWSLLAIGEHPERNTATIERVLKSPNATELSHAKDQHEQP